jgi:hypothetical protein
VTPREYILSRFRGDRARKAGGISQRTIYSGAHSFPLATLDAELAAMRTEGVLGFANGLWFRRGQAVPQVKEPVR